LLNGHGTRPINAGRARGYPPIGAAIGYGLFEVAIARKEVMPQ